MTLETFFSSELILENDTVLLRALTIDDLDSIETISYNKALGEFGARVKNRNDLMDYFNFCLSAKELYPLIIISKESNLPIGITMFGNISFQHKSNDGRPTYQNLRFYFFIYRLEFAMPFLQFIILKPK